MNWYKTIIIAGLHAEDRIQQRLAPYATNINQIIDLVSQIYPPDKSYAVQVLDIGYDQGATYGDISNGNWVIAIMRPYGGKLDAATVMLRRSPNHPDAPQPFTPDALRVNQVITQQQLISDANKARQQAA